MNQRDQNPDTATHSRGCECDGREGPLAPRVILIDETVTVIVDAITTMVWELTFRRGLTPVCEQCAAQWKLVTLLPAEGHHNHDLMATSDTGHLCFHATAPVIDSAFQASVAHTGSVHPPSVTPGNPQPHNSRLEIIDHILLCKHRFTWVRFSVMI